MKDVKREFSVVNSPQDIFPSERDGTTLNRVLNMPSSCFTVTEVEFYRGSSPLSFDLDRKPDTCCKKNLDGRRLKELTHFTPAFKSFL